MRVLRLLRSSRTGASSSKGRLGARASDGSAVYSTVGASPSLRFRETTEKIFLPSGSRMHKSPRVDACFPRVVQVTVQPCIATVLLLEDLRMSMTMASSSSSQVFASLAPASVDAAKPSEGILAAAGSTGGPASMEGILTAAGSTGGGSGVATSTAISAVGMADSTVSSSALANSDGCSSPAMSSQLTNKLCSRPRKSALASGPSALPGKA